MEEEYQLDNSTQSLPEPHDHLIWLLAIKCKSLELVQRYTDISHESRKPAWDLVGPPTAMLKKKKEKKKKILTSLLTCHLLKYSVSHRVLQDLVLVKISQATVHCNN